MEQSLPGRELIADSVLVTGGRLSGATRSGCIGHVSPEAAEGGPIGLLRTGDRIRTELKARRAALHPPDRKLRAGSRATPRWSRPAARAPSSRSTSRPPSAGRRVQRLVDEDIQGGLGREYLPRPSVFGCLVLPRPRRGKGKGEGIGPRGCWEDDQRMTRDRMIDAKAEDTSPGSRPHPAVAGLTGLGPIRRATRRGWDRRVHHCH